MSKCEMRAYHKDANLKASVLAEMAAHRQADRLVQGFGCWRDGKGSAAGCLIKSKKYAEYETRFGLPVHLAQLEDSIFEGLPVAEAQAWPERFLSAITPGTDLSMVFYHFTHWLLVDPENGVLNYAKTARTKKFITKVAGLYKQYIEGIISLAKFRIATASVAAAYAVRVIAAACSYATADTAAYATADTAAYDKTAAYATATAATTAGYDTAAYDAWVTKKQQASTAQANKLIELLEACV